MAELFDGEPDGPETPASLETDGAAVGIALDRARARRRKGGDDAADHFLAAQEALIADQRHHLREQLRHMGLRVWSERLKLTLQALTIALGLAVAAGLAWMAWDAAHADGLVVEAFSVPPDLAARGATGAVVAREVLNSLREIDRGANSMFDVKTSDAFTERTKIALPETGLSLGEVQKALRDWLGHETHLTGEVVETPAGLKIVTRTDAGDMAVVEGPADQLTALTAQAAERIMAKARPNVAAEFYIRRKRPEDARPLANTVLATTDDPLQRSLAEDLLGLIEGAESHTLLVADHFRAAAASPDRGLAAVAETNLAGIEGELGHSAASRAAARAALDLVERSTRTTSNATVLARRRAVALGWLHGDAEAAALLRPIYSRHLPGMVGDSHFLYGLELAVLHDPAARGIVEGPSEPVDDALEDWPAAVNDWDLIAARVPNFAPSPAALSARAQMLARVGRIPEAETLAATLPADCTWCWSVRGLIASLKGDAAGSERAFAQALRLDPTEPSILLSRGRERLRRGQVEPARADFQAANAAAPAWADPLEAWGEALFAKSDAKAAAARFTAAQPLAPRWGRLHLKWGEALAKLGKRDEATAQFRTAAALNLTPDERAELAAQKL